MKSSQLARALAIAVTARMPVHIAAEPGIGKSSIVKQVGRALGKHVIDQRCVQMDAVDARGMPAVVDGRTIWATPAWLPRGPNQIVFLDEFVQAPPMVQNALSELILDRTLGPDYSLPEDTAIIAAGNRRTDRAATYEMPSQLRNRFLHLTLESDLDEWVSWANNPHATPDIHVPNVTVSEALHELVIAFIRFRPSLLQAFDANAVAFPTARSVEYVSKVLPYLLTKECEDLLFPMVAGCTGEGFAIEFTAFIRLAATMPDPDVIFQHPANAPVPHEPGVLYALCAALTARVTAKTIPALFTYLDRIPKDFAFVIYRDVAARDARLLTGKEVTMWAARNAKYLM